MPDRSLIRNRPGLGRSRTPEGRRTLDLAEGVLIGLRRYSAEAAFAELVTVAHRHDLTTSAVASALVNLATGDDDATDSPSVEVAIARMEWGSLLQAAKR